MNEQERKRFDEGLLCLYEGKLLLPNTKPGIPTGKKGIILFFGGRMANSKGHTSLQ